LEACENSPSHKKSESISFRIDKDIIDELRRNSRQKHISLTTLANQIFENYVKFTNTAKDEMIRVLKAIIVELVERCSEDELKSIAERTSIIARPSK